jgi:hypothetical protein
MKTDKEMDDALIRAFMQENKKELPDVFFSRKVMQKLPPVRHNKEWIVIPFAALGSLLSLLLGTDTMLHLPALRVPESFNIYYLLGGVAVIPFVTLAMYYIRERKIQLL